MEKQLISFMLNNRPITLEADPDQDLLSILRDKLMLKGTKRGCDHEGLCGACTVIIDGKSRRSCITKLGAINGSVIETIEGLAGPDGSLHPLQQAFIDYGAVQCGFCTPGILLSAKALLDKNQDPSRNEVVNALRGNLCRCTGYKQIVDAVMAAAKRMAEENCSLPYDQRSSIGKIYRRRDSHEKVTGKFQFLNDVNHEGYAFVKVVRSPYHSAKIVRIDIREASSTEGVIAVITADDIPGTRAFSDRFADDNSLSDNQASEPILAKEIVRYIGEPIVMVVATSEKAATEGAEAIKIEFEVQEPLLRAEEATQWNSSRIHPFGNIYESYYLEAGNHPINLESEDVVVQTKISMHSQAHFPLEPLCAVAYIDEDERVVVEAPTHESFSRRQQIALMLNIPVERVRVIVSQMGGSFGNRHYFWPVVAVALPAYLLKKPVQMVFDRREEFIGTLKRHPVDGRVTISATKEGKFRSLKADIIGNAGPYGNTETIGRFIVECGVGPYEWGAINYHSTFYHTNWSNAGPFRGYGMPQGNVCTEICIDALARKLEIDPWKLRYINAIDSRPVNAWGQSFDEPNGFEKTLELIEPHWRKVVEETHDLNSQADTTKRIFEAGFSGGWYQFGKRGRLKVSCEVGISKDGKIAVYYEGYEAGTGLGTVLTQIVCEELNVTENNVVCVGNDTDNNIPSTIYGACRDVYWVGGATKAACQVLRDRMRSTAQRIYENKGGNCDWILADGEILEKNTLRSLSFKEIREIWDELRLPNKFIGTLNLEDQIPPRPEEFDLSGQFTSGAAAAQILLDKTTGNVKVIKLIIAHDVGKVINPADVEGQVYGGAMFELSSTLYEEYIPGETINIKKYPIARCTDLPEIIFIPVEVSSTYGPYGAKGLGEGLGYIRSAIVNAITRAVGVEMTQLPFTPAKILHALNGHLKNEMAG